MTTTAMLSGALFVFMFVIIALLWYSYKMRAAYHNHLRAMEEYKKEQSKHSGTQRAVIKGQLAEQFYPLTANCLYHPSDMRFMGMPIDYIVFDGYTNAKDEGGHIKEIIFVEMHWVYFTSCGSCNFLM